MRKLHEYEKDCGWVITLSKSATERCFAVGLQAHRKIEETYEDESWFKYFYGDFIHDADNIQQEWPFDKLCLEWVDFIQPYKPTLKDKFCKWVFKKDFPQTIKVRPLDGTLVITSYNDEHYEMVEYSNKRWITDLSFPCEPDKWAYVPEECIKAAHEYIRSKH